jgi:hypothetical protein
MKIDGGCHCGGIRYEAEIDPSKVMICHCTDCQTLSGTAFRTVVPVLRNDFRLVKGSPKIYMKTGESGNKRQRAFCAECGTPIYSAAEKDTPVYSLRVGSSCHGCRRSPERKSTRSRNDVPGKLLCPLSTVRRRGSRGDPGRRGARRSGPNARRGRG